MLSIDIGLSFLEGLALIASPCILPVLPLVLGASIEGGKKRPFGIIIGFVSAFTAFAMFSRALVGVLGINLDIIKYGSLALLALFGLILLSDRLSSGFSTMTQRFAQFGNPSSTGEKNGFFSGIIIGATIGLVWTPCAGPILAAVLVQIIRQESDIHALVLIGVFALGAGLPMLAIAFMGRQFIAKVGYLTTHAEMVRKAFGTVIVLAVVFIASGIDVQSLFTKKAIEPSQHAAGLENALPTPYATPEFTGIQTWLNSGPLTMSALRGHVVLVDFWTYSCINCIRTLPYITKWDQAYHDKGLVIIGVHAPEFEFEKDVANVGRALAKYNIHYPVAIDNRLDTWTAFRNRYWPAHYLIDRQGRVVYTHFGEGNYAKTEHNIRYLLGLNEITLPIADTPVFSSGQTPETYLGYARMQHFASPGPIAKDTVQRFSFPASLSNNYWALSGKWRIEKESIVAAEPDAKLQLNFTAGKVFLVLGTRDGSPVTAHLTLNGKPLLEKAGKEAPDGVVTIDQHALYELVSQPNVQNNVLEITATSPGLEAYAFTFGK